MPKKEEATLLPGKKKKERKRHARPLENQKKQKE